MKFVHATTGVWLLILVALLAPLLSSADYRRFPGAAATERTIQTQEYVESLYSTGNFRRALLIYQKQLAPGGDKYAQYMAGYMHLTGRGTSVDEALALAWYRLAAERQERPFVQARDALQASLSADKLARADRLFAELQPLFGDRRLLLRLISNDVRFLEREQAGLNVALATGFLGGRAVDHVQLARERLAERLAYLEQMPGVAALEGEEKTVRAAIAALPEN